MADSMMPTDHAPTYGPTDDATATMGDIPFIHHITQYIFQPLPIDTIAERCCMSLSCFKRYFLCLFHDTPHHWYVTQRLRYGMHLLLSTSLSVKEIGARCGFHSTSHFIRLFRHTYGLTPTQIRRNMVISKNEEDVNNIF